MDTSYNRKEHILIAAAELFRDRGYAGTSMRDLARAVDLQVSSLYNHIKGKQELLQEICFANARRYQEGLRTIELHSSSATERVRALLDLHIDMATQDFTSITSFNDEWRHLEEPALSHFKQLRRTYEERFLQIIRQGMESGEFRVNDPQLTLFTILSAVRWVYDWYRPERAGRIEEIKITLGRIILEGLT